MNPHSYDPSFLRSQMTLLRVAAAERAGREEAIRKDHETSVTAIDAAKTSGLREVDDRFGSEIAATRKEYEAVLAKLSAQLAAERQKLEAHRQQISTRLAQQAQSQKAKLLEDETFEESSFREIARERKKKPQRLFEKSEQDLATVATAIETCETRIRSLLPACGLEAEAFDAIKDSAAVPAAGGPDGATLIKAVEGLTADIVERTRLLSRLPEARGSLGAVIGIPMVLAVLATGGAAFAAHASGLSIGSTIGIAAGTAAVVVAVGIGGGIWWLRGLRRRVQRQADALVSELASTIVQAHNTLSRATDFITRRRGEQSLQADEQNEREAADRKEKLESRLASLNDKVQSMQADLEEKASAHAQSIESRHEAAQQKADAEYPQRLESLSRSHADSRAEVEQTAAEKHAAADQRRAKETDEMIAAWRKARIETAVVYDEANAIDAAAFLPWDALARDEVALPHEVPPGLRFGSLDLSLEKIPGGVSPTPELNVFGPIAWTQPATLPFPRQGTLLIKTTADQQDTASALLESLTLRIVTGIPPGQSRFTIIDPLGLGEPFAGFMHLADHDELLVTSRIWTETQHIEERLADLSEQMEVVIQKYLRNEYDSIAAYNAEAEVPEPYRFLVVANFPANFTESSARRLASIVSSGGRCGVYVLLSVDTRQSVPSGFSLDELAKNATTLTLKQGTFTWCDSEYSQWPLTVVTSPDGTTFTRIVQRIGQAAKAAKRVEVPFDRVAPPEEEWWQGSTATEVVAPLGPAAAKKLQYLKLGKGTSQHALIAGKTGSGKSTLMHAMITSLALQYSPNEIQFYLVDFKKGVEFKLYDHYALPHARVIAIESEREFGLSVLEQLDRELKRRGDLFRQLSVQDVAGFRKTGHADPMPRILLIIDEFQEIFVEDDKIAQDAALILDRLVRQGRAFGMHVLLGSQTLGGSYSLPRATMGQMAIRIALQCNEADSSLILSEDNTAARLLTRPGEAIYNDANGMVAGNNPFQVVFLNDERRERYLGALRALADRRGDIPQVPRIVFDGNEAADPAGNPLLNELLASGTVHGKEIVAPLAWIGDAIAIKDPTAAIFRRQGGSNLLIVGQREDLGASLQAMAMVSLAVGHDPHPGGLLGRPARFVVLEPAIAEEKPDIMLSRLADALPHEVEVAGRLGVADALERLAGEVQRRIDNQVLDGEAVFLVIRDLGRFRELRKEEGSFGFSFGNEKKVGPAEHFATILRDGPPVGIHSIIWCDSLTNLMRTFERSTVKEFELRTVFQMSGTDSSQLIDSPAASKLGPQRALFIHEETGTLEKFRPYAFPSPEWLAGISERLRTRPQGTPQQRAVPSISAAPPAAASSATSAAGSAQTKVDSDSFGLTGGGFGDFNFTKMLDDLPGGDASSDDDPASDPSTAHP
jgi:energy-coupling factor transporter ATP-binding protein EcfA2